MFYPYNYNISIAIVTYPLPIGTLPRIDPTGSVGTFSYRDDDDGSYHVMDMETFEVRPVVKSLVVGTSLRFFANENSAKNGGFTTFRGCKNHESRTVRFMRSFFLLIKYVVEHGEIWVHHRPE